LLLVFVVLLLSMVSWLAVGTFWLAEGTRLGQEYDEECATGLLVSAGITVAGAWCGLVFACLVGAYNASNRCDCSRASYLPVRRISRYDDTATLHRQRSVA